MWRLPSVRHIEKFLSLSLRGRPAKLQLDLQLRLGLSSPQRIYDLEFEAADDRLHNGQHNESPTGLRSDSAAVLPARPLAMPRVGLAVFSGPFLDQRSPRDAQAQARQQQAAWSLGNLQIWYKGTNGS